MTDLHSSGQPGREHSAADAHLAALALHCEVIRSKNLRADSFRGITDQSSGLAHLLGTAPDRPAPGVQGDTVEIADRWSARLDAASTAGVRAR